jgi:hypothetical protein
MAAADGNGPAAAAIMYTFRRGAHAGPTLSHYEPLEEIGKGQGGYKARDTRLDRFVAIKLLPPEKMSIRPQAPLRAGGEGRFGIESPEYRHHPRD